MKLTLTNNEFFSEAKRLLDEGRELTFTPKGDSMRPHIEGGKDCVTLCKTDSVRVGDIVLAQLSENTFALHRIIAREGDTLTLMGDGNLSGTEHCHISDVMGTVTKITTAKGQEKMPGCAWCWRHTLFARKYLLKFYRKIILKYHLR